MRISLASSIGAFALVASATAGAVAGQARLRRALAATRGELGEARYRASHDPLTGLANRRGVDEELATRTTAGDLGVLLIDLDGFKQVNDTYGHAAGDVVLTAVALRLQRVAADGDLVGRLGGDEFVVLADAGYGPFSAMLARDAVAAIREPITIGVGVTVTVTASVGWVQAQPGDDPRQILQAADRAMYRAKTAGGDRQDEFGTFETLPSPDGRTALRGRDAHPHRTDDSDGFVLVGGAR